MIIIDKNFKYLINTIKKQTLEETYQEIRNKFSKINIGIQKSLEDFFEKFPYWGKLNINEGIYEELYNRALSLNKHIDDFIWLYNNLEDYRSKQLLYAIISNWYQFDFETLENSIEKNYPHYFDLDIINCDKNEVIVDLGSYIGDTVIDYLKYYGEDNYKKIYCYEITDKSFEILKNNLAYQKNIDFRKKAVIDVNGTTFINESIADASANTINDIGEKEIKTVKLDDDINEKITMIKMDIEGSEQKALIGCQKHIKNDKPKLLISVYHNHEDLWKIPKMIKDLNNEYKLYLRYYGNNIFPTEIVLIAI